MVITFFLLGIEELGVQIEEPFSILPMEAFCDASIGNVLNEMVLAEDKARKERAAADAAEKRELAPEPSAKGSYSAPVASAVSSVASAPVVKKIVERVAKVSETVKYAAETVTKTNRAQPEMSQAAEEAEADDDTQKTSRGLGPFKLETAGKREPFSGNTAWTPPKSWPSKRVSFFPGGNPFKRD